MPRGKPVPITPEVLRWAIDESGYSVEELADKLKFDRTEMDRWLAGESSPGITKFRKLANTLKRPMALFFMPHPPESAVPRVDFRHPPTADRDRLNPPERRYLREAARMQRTLAWMIQEIGEHKAKLPRATFADSPEEAARRVRKWLGVSIAQQRQWRDAGEAFKGWRAALDQRGVFVFLFPLGPDSVRGFSIWHDAAPVVAVNTRWNNEARTYTLFHELAHLITRTSAACLETAKHFLRGKDGDTEERWCERFAAALLLPWDAVEVVLRQELGISEGTTVQDVDTVRAIARRFRTSLRAAALRLIEKNHAPWDLYRNLPGWVDEKTGGGGGKGRVRGEAKEDAFGGRTAGIFVRAVKEDVVSRTEALRRLDVPDWYFAEVETRRHGT